MKYKFTDETKIWADRKVQRIQRLSDDKVGGWIEKEENLSHEGDCWVDDEAIVCDDAQVYGKAWVYGRAHVSRNAHVYGNARVYGRAHVSRNAHVYGNAQVSEDAQVYRNAQVYEYAWVYEDARVYGNARVYGDVRVYGNAQVYGDARVHGYARVYGNTIVTESTLVADYTILRGGKWIQSPLFISCHLGCIYNSDIQEVTVHLYRFGCYHLHINKPYTDIQQLLSDKEYKEIIQYINLIAAKDRELFGSNELKANDLICKF